MPQAAVSPPGGNRKSVLSRFPLLLRFPQVFNLPSLESGPAHRDVVKVG